MFFTFLNNKKRNNGFTIIEVLIVVTTIGILAAIIAVAYPAYQERARDTKRKNDLQTLVNAYKLAQADGKSKAIDDALGFYTLYNSYPVTNFFWNGGSWGATPSLSGNTSAPSQLGGKLGEAGYLKETIMDPKWDSPPDSTNYSGYLLIPCLNKKKGGYYGAARLEASTSNNATFNELMTEAGKIPSGGGNPTDTNACFYSPPGDNAADTSPALVLNLYRVLVKDYLSSVSNGYNYAVYAQ